MFARSGYKFVSVRCVRDQVTKGGPMNEFRRLLHEMVTQYGGTKQDLAYAVGITPSRLSHLLAGRAPSVPSTEVCLRLAVVTRTAPSKVLRAAGKGHVADLIEDLYGAAAARRPLFGVLNLKPHEQKYVEAVRALEPREQRAFLFIVQRAASQRPAQALVFDAATSPVPAVRP
jgi:hypothetical protein